MGQISPGNILQLPYHINIKFEKYTEYSIIVQVLASAAVYHTYCIIHIHVLYVSYPIKKILRKFSRRTFTCQVAAKKVSQPPRWGYASSRLHLCQVPAWYYHMYLLRTSKYCSYIILHDREIYEKNLKAPSLPTPKTTIVIIYYCYIVLLLSPFVAVTVNKTQNNKKNKIQVFPCSPMLFFVTQQPRWGENKTHRQNFGSSE